MKLGDKNCVKPECTPCQGAYFGNVCVLLIEYQVNHWMKFYCILKTDIDNK